jgi:DNA polymerase-3 subunit beta
MKITIKPEYIKALLLTAAKQDIRYYLNGIAIDARQNGDMVDVTLVATDGHRLLALALDPADVDAPLVGNWIIDRALLEPVKPVKAGKTEFPLTLSLTIAEPSQDSEGRTCLANPVVTLQGATTATGTVVDGRFPDWRRVMPATSDGISSQFDHEYLYSMGKVGRLLRDNKKECAAVIHHNSNGAALVTFPGAPFAIGVLMPTRVGADAGPVPHPGLPSWAQMSPV